MNIFDTDPQFILTIFETIGRKFTVFELLELINSLKPGEEKEWILKIDEFLENLEEELAEYNIEKTRESIRTYLCIFLMVPRVLYLLRDMLAYLLVLLTRKNLAKLTEVIELDEKDPLFRALSTISCLAIQTAFTNRKAFICNQSFDPLPFPSTEEMGNNLDEEVWNDFNEYLKERGYVFYPLPSANCSIV